MSLDIETISSASILCVVTCIIVYNILILTKAKFIMKNDTMPNKRNAFFYSIGFSIIFTIIITLISIRVDAELARKNNNKK